MESIDQATAKSYAKMTVYAAFLAVFCLFGYRSSFSIMQKIMIADTGWTSTQVSLGYCFMMTLYGITAFFSGRLVDTKGTRPVYFIGAVCCFLGFFLTSFIPAGGGTAPSWAFPLYLFTYGVFAGIGTGMLWVSSTISCRKWYVGAEYGKNWGVAFAGAPLAQLLLTIVVSPILKSAGWQMGMKVLSVIMAVFLVVAGLIAKPMPDKVGCKPFGLDSLPKKAAPEKPAREWTRATAFKTPHIWLDIFAFMFAVMGEFLIWSQIVLFFSNNYSVNGVGWGEYFPLEGVPLLGGIPLANLIYMVIGLAGLFTMPLTGSFSDWLVKKMGDERAARKWILVIAPACGIIGCLLAMSGNIVLIVVGMIILACYWGMEPGGAAGYAGTVFGGKSLGAIWGLATLIVMGIGPSLGTFMGAFLPNATGNPMSTIYFGLFAFAVSLVCGFLLPATAPKED